jgi:hypothetical protein
MQSDWADQTVTALVGFSKIISRVNNAVVENVKRFVLAKATGVQMNAVRYISCQKQQA